MSHHNPTTRPFFGALYTIAIIIVSILLALGAYTKLSMNPSAVALFQNLHLLSFMKAFGMIQIIILLCLWWKPTRIIATLIASAYFGAGVVMMLSLGESALMSTIALLLTWLIHKCSWWSMWKHGYRCGCKACSADAGLLPHTKKWCECGKPGCECEHGKCAC